MLNHLHPYHTVEELEEHVEFQRRWTEYLKREKDRAYKGAKEYLRDLERQLQLVRESKES